MKFVVSARKYRPQNFNEVVGQNHVTDTLQNLIDQNKLAHAFLFTGPRGVGKTTCARIFAKAINCENFVNGMVCGTCASCSSFNSNASFNILELDAASNNSVENIRNLIDQVRFKPQKGKYKVFIIDEVHMLSPAAFNAFLKTLEEPPEYAIFILATTEKHKILPTILSRCQIYDFHRIEIYKIIEQLKSIAQKENIDVEEDALFLIAEKADGALRDALSLFDRLASASDDKVTYQKTVDNLFILDHSYFFRVCTSILKEDASEIMNIFDDVLKKGFQGNHFINGLAMHFRNLLLSKDPQTYQLVEGSAELKKKFIDQAQLYRSDDLMTAIDIANEVDINYLRAQNKRLHVEIGLLKICFLGRNKLSDSTVEKKKLNEQRIASKTQPLVSKIAPEIKAPAPTTESVPITNQSDESVKTASEPSQSSSELIEDKVVKEPSTITNLNSVDALLQKLKAEQNDDQEALPEIKIERLQSVWSSITETLQSASLINVMRKAILSIKDQKIEVRVPNNLSKELIGQEKALLQQIRSQLGSNKFEINIIIDKELFPETAIPKKKMTLNSKEKYDLLVKQNPLLQDFVRKFDLKAIDKF